MYLELGLRSEIGELVGKVAKLYRGDKTIEGMREDIIKEVGDILWFVSQASHYYSFNGVIDWSVIDTEITDYGVCTKSSLSATCYSLMELDYYTDDADNLELVLDDCRYLLDVLHCPLEECLQMNYDKLTARKADGTIKGSGDDVRTV